MPSRQITALPAAPDGFVIDREEREVEATDYRRSATRAATLRISWPAGSRAKALRLVVFCAAWFGFLGFWYAKAYRAEAPAVTFLFPVLHVVAGVVLLHRTLVTFLNTTRLTLASGVLEVQSGPVPVGGDVQLAPDRIRRLFVSRQERQGRRGRTLTSFSLEAVLEGGARTTVVRGLEDARAAHFLEAVVEDALGLEPEPVFGEVSR